MNKKLWLMFGIIFLLVISFVVSPDGTGFDMKTIEGEQAWNYQVYKEGNTDQGVLALLNVYGVITSGNTSLTNENGYDHAVFLRELEDAFRDPDTRGVLIRVNSPGGGVYESAEVYEKILDLKQKYDKPYVVYMEQLAASGGYYISLPADAIYANRNSMTGSIGVIISTINYNQLAENIGVEEVVFKSGPNKDMLNPMRAITPEEEAIMTGIMAESYNDFFEAFMLHRELSREQALPLADGRIYTARQAQAADLIDEVGDLDQAIKGLSDLAGLEDSRVVEYLTTPLSPFDKLLGIVEEGPRFQWMLSRIGLGLNAANKLEFTSASPYPRAMYISHWN
ncbi:MAG: signal peptide peptidase SppA [Bacillota bacterium]|nr:signal peptide peptidase SppA [Bacillota bacterium]